MKQFTTPYTANYAISCRPNLRMNLLNASDEFLKNLISVIDEHIDDHLSVGFLATNMAVSKSTLNRRLLSLTGLSANEIIRHFRLTKAASLLAQGRNVSEVAYLTGFETPSYFILRFREFYKQTPKKFALEHRYAQPFMDDDRRNDWLTLKTA